MFLIFNHWLIRANGVQTSEADLTFLALITNDSLTLSSCVFLVK